MRHAVVDASVLIEATAPGTGRRAEAQAALAAHPVWTVPHHFDLECLSAWRGMVRRGMLSVSFLRAAMAELTLAPLDRRATHGLHDRMVELDANLTPYDAAYVVLAEVLEVPLLTADARLTRAPGPRCEFILV